MPVALYPPEFRARLSKPQRRRLNTRTVTMPERVGPHVKLVFAEMARLQFTYDEVAEGSGVRRASMKAWRRKNKPSLENLQSVLAFLGWDYCPVPALETLPPALAGDVVELARKAEASVPYLWAAMVGVGIEQRLLNMSISDRCAVIAERQARIERTNGRRKRTSH